MGNGLDYIMHLRLESARFGEAIAAAAPDARIATCPDWTNDDLLWHLTKVQSWWATIVSRNISGPEAEAFSPARPGDRPALLQLYRQASRDLEMALMALAPDTPRWTWSDVHTVGFVQRRQAHEALIHRVDAELAAGDRTAMDPALSADGVDEVLRVIYSGVPVWGRFTPDDSKTLRIHATDTGDTWLVTLGRFTGTDPGGTSYDEADIQVADTDTGQPAQASVSGVAADLDCWLWHRPPLGPIRRSGAGAVLSAFDTALAPGAG